jgi:S1-C subfamily serine protease
VDASPEIVKHLLPSVANLYAQVPAKHPSAAILGRERMGTGTIVDPGGLILTVNYVVMGSETIWVTLTRGRRLKAELVAQDFDIGLALVRVKRQDLPAIELGSSTEVEVGQEIFVLASTGAEERRVSGGLITYVGEFDAYWEYSLERALIVSATNPGFGGGPLLTLTGQMIGVTSLNLNELARYALAIPIERYREHYEEWLRFGTIVHRPRRAWLGLFAHPVEEGVVIAGLVPSGPAERSGLQEGDLIVTFNAEEIATRKAFYSALWRNGPGERLVIEVMRDGRLKRFEAVSGDRAEFYRQGATIDR